MPTLSEALAAQRKRSTSRTLKSVLDSRKETQVRKSRVANPFASKTSATTLSELDGLAKLAALKGFGNEVDNITADPKLSTLQRLSAGLGAFNPADAILQSLEGTTSFLQAYPTDIVQGIASAFTGDDYGEQTKKRYYSELVGYLGVENKYARFGLGLVGDILLDPSTFFGGSLVRGAAKGISLTAKTAGTVAARVAPKPLAEAGAKFIESGKELFDVTGKLFVDGYGATKESVKGYYRFRDKATGISRGLAVSNLKRYGNDVLTDDQWSEFIDKMLVGKEKEFEFYDHTLDSQINALNTRFPGLSKLLTTGRKGVEEKIAKEQPEQWAKMNKGERDLYVKQVVRSETLSRLSRVGPTMQKKIGKLQTARQKLAEPLISGDLIGLKNVVAGLKKEINELVGVNVTKKDPTKPFMGTPQQHDAAIVNALGYQKDQLKKQILDLQSKITGIEKGVIEPVEAQITEVLKKSERYNANEIVQMAMRGVDKNLLIKDKITELDHSIFKLVNEMNEKSHLLENVLQFKSTAKGIISEAFKTGDFSGIPDDVARALQPTSNDPKVLEAIKERLTRNAEVAAKAEIEDPYTIYAPHLKKEMNEKDRIIEFFQGTRRLGVGSEGYKKEFRNLLKDDELIKDRSLFLRIEDQVATNNVKREFMNDLVSSVGKPLTAFKNDRAAEKAGYIMLREKGMFGKEIGYVLKNDFDFINGKIGNTYPALDAIAKATGFDAMNSLFKRFVTGPFASFYVRNFASGKMQNYEVLGYHALLPQTIANGTRIAHRISRGAYTEIDDYFKIGSKFNKAAKKFGNEFIAGPAGKRYAMDDVAQAINDRFSHSTFYNNDYNSLTREADLLLGSEKWSQEMIRSVKTTAESAVSLKANKNIIGAVLSEDAPWWRTGRIVGNYIELNQKSEAVVGALYKGHTLDEALDIAEKAGFDYSKITAFESKVLRRIIPFYTFARKNVELQLKTIGTNPQRINHIIRSIGNAQNLFEYDQLTEKEKKFLPTYLRENLSVPAGKNSEGAAIFIQGFGTPIEAFTNLVKGSADGRSSFERTFLGTINQVTPYLKAPVEHVFGVDTFRMQDIQDIYNAKEYRDAPQFIKDFLKLEEIKKTTADGKTYTVYASDPDRYHVMRSLFTHRGFTYFANVFNEDLPGFLRVMESVSGIRSDEVNLDYYQGLTERRQKEEIGNILQRYGILGEFTRLFIPKK